MLDCKTTACTYDVTLDCFKEKALNNPYVGRNSFMFKIQPFQDTVNARYQNLYKFEPYAVYWNGSRDVTFNSSVACLGCAHQAQSQHISGGYCAKLIQYDGWKIKDDYPIKF